MPHGTFGKIKTAVHRNYQHTVCAYKLNWTTATDNSSCMYVSLEACLWMLLSRWTKPDLNRMSLVPALQSCCDKNLLTKHKWAFRLDTRYVCMNVADVDSPLPGAQLAIAVRPLDMQNIVWKSLGQSLTTLIIVYHRSHIRAYVNINSPE